MIGTNQTEISFVERGFIPDDYKKVEAIQNIYEREIKNGCTYA